MSDQPALMFRASTYTLPRWHSSATNTVRASSPSHFPVLIERSVVRSWRYISLSRSREYLADATGADFAGNPEGLARALEKLGAYSGRVPMDANPATAHMFISNPLSGRGVMSLFSTHPPMPERIARLRGTPNIKTKSGSGSSRMESDAKNFWKRLSDE